MGSRINPLLEFLSYNYKMLIYRLECFLLEKNKWYHDCHLGEDFANVLTEIMYRWRRYKHDIKFRFWFICLITYCYIITDWYFFYINHFSLIIFYLSLWLDLELFSSKCRCTHIEYSSSSRAEDMTIINVIIKTPVRKYYWGVNDVMPGSDGLRIWWFRKRR